MATPHPMTGRPAVRCGRRSPPALGTRAFLGKPLAPAQRALLGEETPSGQCAGVQTGWPALRGDSAQCSAFPSPSAGESARSLSPTVPFLGALPPREGKGHQGRALAGGLTPVSLGPGAWGHVAGAQPKSGQWMKFLSVGLVCDGVTGTSASSFPPHLPAFAGSHVCRFPGTP